MRLILNAIIAAVLIFGAKPSAADPEKAGTVFDDDIIISESSANGLTLTYIVPAAIETDIEGYPKTFRYPRIPNTAQNRIEGEPLLPIKVVPIGVPFNSDIRITVLNQSFIPLESAETAPYICAASENKFQTELVRNQRRISSWPAKIAWLAGEDIIRGLRIAKVAIAPVRIDGARRQKAEKIVVRIDFQPVSRAEAPSLRPAGPIFDEILKRLVVNHEIAAGWRIDWPPQALKAQTAATAFDSSSVWLKMEIFNTGIYRINRFDLSNAGLDVSRIDPRQIRIFYGGGDELPFANETARPVLFEIPIEIIGGDDGVFDFGDQVLFFGESVDRFEFNESAGRFTFQRNHYTSRNVYWLTYGGDFGGPPRRWARENGSPAGTPLAIMTSFTDFTHDEQEFVFYRTESSGEFVNYFDWYWGRGQNFTASIQTADALGGIPAKVIVKTRNSFSGLMVNGAAATRDSVYRNPYYYLHFFTTQNLQSGYNTLVLSNAVEFFLDYIEIHYSRHLRTIDNVLAFTSPTLLGLIEYRVAGSPGDYVLLDIASPDSVRRIVNGIFSGDTLRFQQVNTRRHRFFMAAPSRFKMVGRYSLYQRDNLRDPANRADYIMITHPEFREQTEQLAEHRARQNPELEVRVVNIDDIFNQFSWGLYDPIAIRDFLKYAYENWSGASPGICLLVGDGHYDFRNNLGGGHPIFIPPFEAADPPEAGASGSDENFIYFGRYGYFDSDSSGSLDMIIGRLGVNSQAELQGVVDKIIDYEVNPDMGKWRNNIIVVADDNLGGQTPYETFHTSQAEALSNFHVPRTMEVQKIYLVEYPTRAGNFKTDARETLVRAINNGALIVDWIGHGNKNLWAHEQVFRRVEDIPRLRNGRKLPLMLAASCSIGFFDAPADQSMAEDLVRHQGGGAVASIGATRVVYAGPNTDLNNEIFDQILFEDSTSFGGAFFLAKYIRQLNSPSGPIANDRNYVFLGDPGMIAAKPYLKSEFTYRPDSLKGLSVDSVAGRIYDSQGRFVSDFDGTVWVVVKDASIRRHKAILDYNNQPLNPPNYVYVDYTLPGPTLFFGPAEVTDGRFSASFFVPKDISYGGSGAKIYVYFANEMIDGSGIVDSLPISGSAAGEIDTTGPQIEFYYNGTPVTGKLAVVSSGATVAFRLFDEHGINITGSMGHGIVMTIDGGRTYTADITADFRFDLGSWQSGGVSAALPLLPDGDYTIGIKAWDSYNNSSVYTSPIRVFGTGDFSLFDVMNYPNPAVQTDSTTFQYVLSRPAETVTIKIFTLSGRLVKTIRKDSPQYTVDGHHFLPYDLRDDDGDRLASGVYIYRIEATGYNDDGRRQKDSFQSKLVIMR